MTQRACERSRLSPLRRVDAGSQPATDSLAGTAAYAQGPIVHMEHGVVAWFLDRCRENARVVKDAPEAFVIMAIVVAAIVYFVIDKLHSERFADLGERIAFLDDRLKDYQNQLHGATPEDAAKKIDTLTRKLDEAELKIANLQKKTEPRSLSNAELSAIGKAVSEYQSIPLDIWLVGDSADLPSLSERLSNTLEQSARWKPLTWAWSGIGPVVGAHILVKKDADQVNVAAADALANALQNTRLPASLERWPNDKWGAFGGMLNGPEFKPERAEIRLVLGSKPQ